MPAACQTLLERMIRFSSDADVSSLEELRPSWVQSPTCTSKRSRTRRRLHRPAGPLRTNTHTHRHSLSHTCLHWLLKDVQPKSKSPEVVKLVVPQSPHMRSRISCGILAHWPNPPTAYSIGYSVRFILTFEGIGFKAQFGPRNEREPSVSFLDRVARLDA